MKMFPLTYNRSRKNNVNNYNKIFLSTTKGTSFQFPQIQTSGEASSYTCRGSITVETAMVLPLFVCFMVFVLFFFRILQVQIAVSQALDYAGRRTAAECCLQLYEEKASDQASVQNAEGQEETGDDTTEQEENGGGGLELLGATAFFQKELKKQGCPAQYIRGGALGISLLQSKVQGEYIELKAVYKMKLPVRLLGSIQYRMVQEAKCRKWIGFLPQQDQEDSDEWLYYTQYGSVYHSSRSCAYLDLSIHGIPYSQVDAQRNSSGGKYHKCASCAAQKNGMVYITDYGDCYHGSLACSGLKRCVFMIRKKEATGKRMCTKCGEGN